METTKQPVSFTMVVEETPRLELELSTSRGYDSVPDLIVDADNRFYVKVGRYASPGNRFRYWRRTPYQINYRTKGVG